MNHTLTIVLRQLKTQVTEPHVHICFTPVENTSHYNRKSKDDSQFAYGHNTVNSNRNQVEKTHTQDQYSGQISTVTLDLTTADHKTGTPN